MRIRDWLATVGLVMCFALACNSSSSNASPGTGDSGATSTSTDGAGPGSTSGGVGGGVDYQACFACGDAACAEQAATCDSTSGCRGLLDCIFACAQTDGDCQLGCVSGVDAASAEAVAASEYYTCTILACLDDCAPDTTTGVGGAGTTSTASTSTDGAPPVEPVVGINWLSFDGSSADPAALLLQWRAERQRGDVCLWRQLRHGLMGRSDAVCERNRVPPRGRLCELGHGDRLRPLQYGGDGQPGEH